MGAGYSYLWIKISGAFNISEHVEGYGIEKTPTQFSGLVNNLFFDASKAVPTSSENKPYTILSVPIYVY